MTLKGFLRHCCALSGYIKSTHARTHTRPHATRALPCVFRLLCCQAREREAALVYSTPAGRLDWRVPALHACYCRAISVGALTLRIPLPAAGRQLTGKKRLLTGLEFKRLNESYNTNQTSNLYLLDYKAKNKLSMHSKHAG